MALTDSQIRNARPSPKPLKLFDGEGLFLLVTPSGGKWWRFKYRYGGKEKLLSLGTYPEIKLAEARKRKDAARQLLANRVDPGEARKAEKVAAAGADSFETIAREWYAKFSPGWAPAHGERIIRRLERGIFRGPNAIGAMIACCCPAERKHRRHARTSHRQSAKLPLNSRPEALHQHSERWNEPLALFVPTERGSVPNEDKKTWLPPLPASPGC